jgi:hypothetical protein
MWRTGGQEDRTAYGRQYSSMSVMELQYIQSTIDGLLPCLNTPIPRPTLDPRPAAAVLQHAPADTAPSLGLAIFSSSPAPAPAGFLWPWPVG